MVGNAAIWWIMLAATGVIVVDLAVRVMPPVYRWMMKGRVR